MPSTKISTTSSWLPFSATSQIHREPLQFIANPINPLPSCHIAPFPPPTPRSPTRKTRSRHDEAKTKGTSSHLRPSAVISYSRPCCSSWSSRRTNSKRSDSAAQANHPNRPPPPLHLSSQSTRRRPASSYDPTRLDIHQAIWPCESHARPFHPRLCAVDC